MRISSQQAFNLGVKGIQNNYAELIRTQQQISTGNRILTPADDPVASVRLMQLEQQQNMLGQYKDNLVAANNSLVQEESVLNSVNDIMQRIRVLAEEAGNGALSQSDRQSIAAELREREDELLGLMNTKNARGEYLFSGFQGKTQPFVRQGDGSFVYMGDEGQRKLQVASSLDIAISDNGKKVFQNVTNAARLDATYAQQPAGSLTVSSPLVQDEIAYASAPGYPASQFEIRFNDPANPKNYEIFETTTGTSLQTGSMDDDDKLHDTLVFAGVVVHLDGVPDGTETISIKADPAREKQGVLDTIDQTRGDIGARMNIIETTQTNNEDVMLVNQAVQAELREVDYPEALSKLAFQSIILEAAQQSYVKISNLNLFNKL